MTVGIDDGKFYLIDNWPGNPTAGPNPSSWTAVSATEDFPLGTKRQVYDDTNNGWATLMYLYYTTGAGTVAAATVKSICGIDTTAMATNGQYCHVTNDGSDAQLLGPMAIALGTLVTARFAWFWIGGVCPVDTVPGLDGVFKTDDSITAGTYCKLVDDASILKFELATASTAGNLSAFSCADDANAS